MISLMGNSERSFQLNMRVLQKLLQNFNCYVASGNGIVPFQWDSRKIQEAKFVDKIKF